MRPTAQWSAKPTIKRRRRPSVRLRPPDPRRGGKPRTKEINWSLLSTVATAAAAIAALIFTGISVNSAADGQLAERFSKAVEQLGSDRLSARIGGVHLLERIAHDSARDHPAAMDVLAAFIRDRAPASQCPKDVTPQTVPAADVQAAVGAIARREVGYDREGRTIGLNDACLVGAKIDGADLRNGNFWNSNFSHAYLAHADLSGTWLDGVVFRGANLIGANLDRAKLDRAVFANADLREASLRGTNLSTADLTGADLTSARGVDRTPSSPAVPSR